MKRRRKKHRPEEINAKLRDADAMLNAGKDLGAVLQALEIGDTALARWRAGYRRRAVVGGGMKSEEANRLHHLEGENKRLKTLVTAQTLDIQRSKQLSKGNR